MYMTNGVYAREHKRIASQPKVSFPAPQTHTSYFTLAALLIFKPHTPAPPMDTHPVPAPISTHFFENSTIAPSATALGAA